jgi:hypothetical protein
VPAEGRGFALLFTVNVPTTPATPAGSVTAPSWTA